MFLIPAISTVLFLGAKIGENIKVSNSTPFFISFETEEL